MRSIHKTLVSRVWEILPSKVKKSVQFIVDYGYTYPLDVEREEQILYIKYLHEGMIVFDVVVNIGENTFLFSRFVGENGKIFPFEACPTMYKKLESICHQSGHNNITLNILAVSDTIDYVDFYVYRDEYSGWNSLVKRPLEKYGINIKPFRCDKVQSITTDRFCEDNNLNHSDLLKIDVEGAEYQVLLDSEQMLRQKAIKCCVFEFGTTTFDMGNTPVKIENYLTHLGYSIRNIVLGNRPFPGRKNASTAQFSMHVAEPL